MKAKTGRKRQNHIDSETGLPVVGLSRRPDGRWRIIGTHKTFREPDERAAIRKFYDMTDARTRGTVGGIEIDAPRSQVMAVKELLDKIIQEDRAAYWQRVGEEIRATPKLAAELSGIEQLAYFQDLKPPEPLPSLKEIGQTWWDHAESTNNERQKVRDTWADFIQKTGIKSLRDITPKVVVAYKDAVDKLGLKPKTKSHRFNKLRRILRFARDRAIAVEEITRCLGCLTVLKARGTVTLAPKPIEVKDFQTLLDKATGDDRAMILLMLNAAMYLKEVVRVRWDEIKEGCLVTRRAKKGNKARESRAR